MSQFLYLDSSALVKLVIDEAESPALRSLLSQSRLVSSALARIETTRVARLYARSLSAVQPRRRTLDEVEAILGGVELLAIDASVVEGAARLEPASLRSLDAIHLATALGVAGLDALVTYDDELGRAAEANGLRVLSPGRPA